MYEDPLDQPDLPPLDPPPPMPLGKVVLLNFGIMLVYMTLSSLVDQGGSEAGLAGLIFDAFLLVLQVGINVIGGAILLYHPETYRQSDVTQRIAGRHYRFWRVFGKGFFVLVRSHQSSVRSP